MQQVEEYAFNYTAPKWPDVKHAFVATGTLKNIRLTVSAKIYLNSDVQ